MIEVVAALIWRGERFLICKRPEGKARALLWEFVGGKVEKGESKEDTLVRECREELGISVRVKDEYARVIHAYPDVEVNLTLFNAEIVSGEPKLLEHADIKWITRREIPFYDFCPADADILEKLRFERTYRFFGWERVDKIRPIKTEFEKIKTPKDLYDMLLLVWSEYSCAPRLREKWSKNNITVGQCTVTAFLAQDIFGGEVKGVLLPSGNYHCFNETGGVQFDLTSEQFGDEKLSYADCPTLIRSVQMPEEKRVRYEYLKEQLKKALQKLI